MSSYKSCFYCKQNISASEFKKHLKNCNARSNKPKNNKPPQFGAHGGGGNNAYSNNNQGNYGGNMGRNGNPSMSSSNNSGNPNPNDSGNQGNNNGWNCPMCSWPNKMHDATCTMCRQGKRPVMNNAQGGGGGQGGGQGGGYNQGGNANNNQGPPPSGNMGGVGAWQCPSCTFYNSDVAVSCKICQNPKPKKVQGGGAAGGGAPQGGGHPQPPLPPNPAQQQQQNNNGYYSGNNGGNNGGNNNNNGDPFAKLDANNDQFMAKMQNPVQRSQFSFNNNNNPQNGGGEGDVLYSDPPSNSVKARAAMFQQKANNNNNNNNNYGGNNNNSYNNPNQNGYNNNNNNNNGMGMNNNNGYNNNGYNQPPPQQYQQQQPPPQNYGNNNNNFNNNGNGNNNDDYSQYTGFDDMDLASMDPDTRKMIIEMLGCSKCKKAKADLELNCGHKLCTKCAKSYLFDGFVKKKWETQSITCPMGGCDQQLPDVALRNCGISENMISEIEAQQRKFLVSSDDNMTQCPKCKNYFMTESGDVNAFNPKEKGPDGKPLSYEAQKHKAQWRFRCSQCTTIFCGSCKTVPYHLGYNCQQWKNYQEAKKCRFCEKQLRPGQNEAPKEYGVGPGLANVCNDAECLKKRSWSCDRVLPCGHNCIGMRGERDCMQCLHPKCAGKNASITNEEFCNICWVDPLFAAPTIKLECNHYFHFMCVWNKIDRKWPAARITFGFLNCPLCKKEMRHEAITEMAKKYFQLKTQIKKDAIERLKIEGLEDDKRLTDPNSPYYNNIEQFALDRLAFYPCSKCKKPYFGGMKACEEAGMEREEKYDQSHLVCGGCASGPNSKSCALHGKKYITYKCKFCCSQATWFCWGNTHFCDKCHKKQEKGIYLNRKPISELPKCPGKDLCPLRIEHPPNGVAEFSLGCVVCMRK